MNCHYKIDELLNIWGFSDNEIKLLDGAATINDIITTTFGNKYDAIPNEFIFGKSLRFNHLNEDICNIVKDYLNETFRELNKDCEKYGLGLKAWICDKGFSKSVCVTYSISTSNANLTNTIDVQKNSMDARDIYFDLKETWAENMVGFQDKKYTKIGVGQEYYEDIFNEYKDEFVKSESGFTSRLKEKIQKDYAKELNKMNLKEQD